MSSNPQNIKAVETLKNLDKVLQALTIPPPNRRAMDHQIPSESDAIQPLPVVRRQPSERILKSSLVPPDRSQNADNRPKKSVRIVGHIDPEYDNQANEPFRNVYDVTGRNKILMSASHTIASASGSSAGSASLHIPPGEPKPHGSHGTDRPRTRLPARGGSSLLDLKARLTDATGMQANTPKPHIQAISSEPNIPIDATPTLPPIPPTQAPTDSTPPLPPIHLMQAPIHPDLPRQPRGIKRKGLLDLAAGLKPAHAPVSIRSTVQIQQAADRIPPATVRSVTTPKPSPVGQHFHQTMPENAIGVVDEVMPDVSVLASSGPSRLTSSAKPSLTHGTKGAGLLSLAARLPVAAPTAPPPPRQRNQVFRTEADDVDMDADNGSEDRIPLETIIKVKMEQAEQHIGWQDDDGASEEPSEDERRSSSPADDAGGSISAEPPCRPDPETFERPHSVISQWARLCATDPKYYHTINPDEPSTSYIFRGHNHLLLHHIHMEKKWDDVPSMKFLAQMEMTRSELKEFHNSLSHMYPYETYEQYCETVDGLEAIRKRQLLIEIGQYRTLEALKIRLDRCRNSVLDLLEA